MANKTTYANVGSTVERFMSGALDKEIHQAVMGRAVVGAIIMAMPLFGIETIGFAIVLWNMYSKISEISHVPFRENFKKNIAAAVVINLLVALLLCWIPVVDEIASAFVAFLTISLSGTAYVAALKKVHGKKSTANLNIQKGIDAIKQNKEIDGYASKALESAEKISIAKTNARSSWENRDYKGCVDACEDIADTIKNRNNLSRKNKSIEDIEPLQLEEGGSEEIVMDNIPEELPIAQEQKKRNSGSASAHSRSKQHSTKIEQLRELKSLLDDGILTRDEFNAEKAKILNN